MWGLGSVVGLVGGGGVCLGVRFLFVGVLWCGGGCLWCVVVCCGVVLLVCCFFFVSAISGIRLELVVKILLLFSYSYAII